MVADGIAAHQLGEPRHALSVGQDGGVQSCCVALGVHVGQAVGITSCRTDAAASCFLEGAVLARVLWVWERTHERSPTATELPTAGYDVGDSAYGGGSAQSRASIPSSPHQTSGTGSAFRTTGASIFRGRSGFIRASLSDAIAEREHRRMVQ